MCVLFVDELNHLKEENKIQKSADKGDIYVRWGKQTCPLEVAETVYSGVIGYGDYTDTDSPYKYVCASKMILSGAAKIWQRLM